MEIIIKDDDLSSIEAVTKFTYDISMTPIFSALIRAEREVTEKAVSVGLAQGIPDKFFKDDLEYWDLLNQLLCFTLSEEELMGEEMERDVPKPFVDFILRMSPGETPREGNNVFEFKPRPN